MISYEVGCRFFQISYPFDISELGKAIMSEFYTSENSDLFNEHLTIELLKDTTSLNVELKIIDLNEKIFEKDSSVLKEKCGCFTCKNNYTKAYIHHLLKCKELNANILLIM